jgi:hypothetical protein
MMYGGVKVYPDIHNLNSVLVHFIPGLFHLKGKRPREGSQPVWNIWRTEKFLSLLKIF